MDNTIDLMKRCSKCKTFSSKSIFHKDRKSKDRLTSHCKLRRKIYRKSNIMNFVI